MNILLETNQVNKKWNYWVIIFCVSSCLILLQSALTRVLSAASTYHGTFFVISFVMLGLAKSSIEVYKKIQLKELGSENINKALFQGATYSVLAYLAFSNLIVRPLMDFNQGIIFILSAFIFFFPFERCGFVIASILYLERKNAAWIYWGDLLGAAITAALLSLILDLIPSPLVFFFSAFILSICLILVPDSVNNRNFTINSKSLLTSFVFLLVFISGLVFPKIYFLPFPISLQTESLEYDKWNSLSRVAVFNENSDYNKYISNGWGMSSKFNGQNPVLKWLNIDSGAGTQIIKIEDKDFHQNIDRLEFLKWDVTNSAYELAESKLENVFIIGGGGGRDIISAALYGASNIDVAELNPLIVDAVNNEFSDFSKKPYSLPQVSLTIGEGRHTISKSDKLYDLLQMSMIDTDAASVAGSFALTENSLYTLEAFELFISKLSDNGIFSLSRWWLGGSNGETGRALALVYKALENIGINNPKNHIVLLYNQGELPLPVTTLIVKKSGFNDNDLEKVYNLAVSKGFEIILPTNDNEKSKAISYLIDNNFSTDLDNVYDLSLPTDDRPFFFNFKRPINSWIQSIKSGDFSLGSHVSIIFLLTFIALTLSCYSFIYKPAKSIYLKLNSKEKLEKNQLLGLTLYFSSIGLGFMFIEIAMLQKFSIFLGHPNYSLSVTLFSVLLFSSFGSLFSKYFHPSTKLILCLLTILLFFILTSIYYLPEFLLNNYAKSLIERKILSISILAPISFIMGMFLPLGIKSITYISKDSSIMLAWAINGIFSVIGSVTAIIIAVNMGFSYLIICSGIIYTLTLPGVYYLLKK